MFRVIVNGCLIGNRKFYGDAKALAVNALKSYTNKPIVTIENKIGYVVEIVK